MELRIAEIQTKPVKTWEEIVEEFNLPKPIFGNDGPDGIYPFGGGLMSGEQISAIVNAQQSEGKECPYPGFYKPDFLQIYPPGNPNIPVNICSYPDNPEFIGNVLEGNGRMLVDVPPGYVLDYQRLYEFMSQYYPDIFNGDIYATSTFANDLSFGATTYYDRFLPSGEVLVIPFSNGRVCFGPEDYNTCNANSLSTRPVQLLSLYQQALVPASEYGLEGIYVVSNIPRIDAYNTKQDFVGAGTFILTVIAVGWAGYIGIQRQIEKYRAKSQPSGDAS